MRFDLEAQFTFSSDVSSIISEIHNFISIFNKNFEKKDPNKSVDTKILKIKNKSLFLDIVSEGNFRPHNALLQIKNSLSKELGKKHHLGIREIEIISYKIEFE